MTRQMVLRNREINQNAQKLDNNKFSGVTTRKRAALNALENDNTAKLIERPNKIANKTKLLEVKEVTEIPQIETMSNENKENNPLTFEDLVRNPVQWPLHSEIQTSEQIEELLKHLKARRKVIRGHYSNNNGTPIWFMDDSKQYDELMHSEYIVGIHDYLMDYEIKHKPLGRNFLDGSPKIGARQRYIFVDWMVQTQLIFQLSAETFYLAMAVLDRFFKEHKDAMKVQDLIMVGSMALFIAAKVEEVFPPNLEDYITEIKQEFDPEFCHFMEMKIIKTVDCRLSIPLPISFIRHYNTIIKASVLSHFMSRYFCELSVQDYVASGYSINLMSASCVCLAQVICQMRESNFETVWTEKLQAASGLLYTDIKPLVRNLCIVLSKQPTSSKYRTISLKYSSEHYSNVYALSLNSVAYRNLLRFFKEEHLQQQV